MIRPASTPFISEAPVLLVQARGLMTPDEVDFWQRVRVALREQGNELVLITHHDPKAPMDVPYVRVPNSLDNLWQAGANDCSAALSKCWPGEKENAFLLQREMAWWGGNQDPTGRRRRRYALYIARAFYAQVLRQVKPGLTIIWNGTHAQEIILARLCEAIGTPVSYIERAFIPGMIQIDSSGILGGSSLAQQSAIEWQDADEQKRWRSAFDRVTSHTSTEGTTWWEQPGALGPDETRRRLKIPDGAMVLLFAGQVDADAQNLLFSPHFSGSLDAFRWFCEAVSGIENIFVLGKHHPKSADPVSAFQEVVGDQGVWTDEVSIEDAIGVADRVVAVNSTVIYEALMRGVPALAMGLSLLSNKGIAYELADLRNGRRVIESWIRAEDFQQRLNRWRDFGAWALNSSFYAMTEVLAKAGAKGPDAIAREVAGNLSASPDFSRLPGNVSCALANNGTMSQYGLRPAKEKRSGIPGHVPFWRHLRRAAFHLDGLILRIARTEKRRLQYEHCRSVVAYRSRRLWFHLMVPVRIARRLRSQWQTKVSYGVETRLTPDHLREREPGEKRILMVSHVQFWKTGNGTGYRVQGLLRGLAAHGIRTHLVHLGSIAGSDLTPEGMRKYGIDSITAIPNWQAGCRGTRRGRGLGAWWRALRGAPLPTALPDGRTMRDYDNPFVERLVARLSHQIPFDAFLLEYVYMASLTQHVPARSLKIVDTIDVLHLRQASFEARAWSHPIKVSRQEEAEALNHFDIVVAIQEKEADVLRSMVSADREVVTCYPALLKAHLEGSDRREGDHQQHTALYVASLNEANMEGLVDLLENIWPLVLEREPDARLDVCGSICDSFEGVLPQGVSLRGFVPDLGSMYANADVVVNPVRIGAGLKIKVLEALEYARPIVATPHAVEGFPETAASGIAVADRPDEFAAAVLRFLTDGEQRQLASRVGKQYAGTYFALDSAVGPLVTGLDRRACTSQGPQGQNQE